MNFFNTSLMVNKEWKPGDLLSIETAVDTNVTALIVKDEDDDLYLVNQATGEVLHLNGYYMFSSSQDIKEELHDCGMEVTHFSSEDFSLEIKLKDYIAPVEEPEDTKTRLRREFSPYTPPVGLYSLETGERIEKPLSYHVHDSFTEGISKDDSTESVEEETKPSVLESSRRFLEERKKQVKELADLYNIPELTVDLKDFGPKTLEAVKQSLRGSLPDPVPCTEEAMQSTIYNLSYKLVEMQKELDEIKENDKKYGDFGNRVVLADGSYIYIQAFRMTKNNYVLAHNKQEALDYWYAGYPSIEEIEEDMEEMFLGEVTLETEVRVGVEQTSIYELVLQAEAEKRLKFPYSFINLD